jgi:hypothetical protein
MPPQIIENDCMILDTKTGEFIKFQMMPDSISDSKSVNWNQIQIVGRSHPILAYDSSASRTFSFTLYFFAHPSHEDPTTQGTVVENIRFLTSLTYPDYGGGVKPPHKCVLRIGSMIQWAVVAQDISVSYTPMWKNGLPVYASVSCTFIESADNPVDYGTVRSGGVTWK